MEPSIQQSPIDPIFEEDDFEEETPRPVPVEIKLEPAKLRVLQSTEWIHQLVKPLKGEGGTLTVSNDNNEAILIRSHNDEIIRISLSGLDLTQGSSKYSILEEVPRNILEKYFSAFSLVENWRARVVCLSMETEEIECSLMDDIFPPRSILAEYKSHVVLRSIKLQKGMVFITTVMRTVSLPLSVIENDRSIKSLLANIAPELMVIDMDIVWTNFVQLRILCLDEHKRINDKTTCMHGG